MLHSFDAILEAVSNSPAPFYYIPNRPGNWGDSLIRYATLAFFQDSGVEFREMRPWNRSQWVLPYLRGGTVLYGGGGGWCRNWNHSCVSVRKASRRFQVIVLPSSYEMSYNIPNTIFFRRDNSESQENMPESRFSHDLAFYYQTRVKSSDKTDRMGFFFRVDSESSGRHTIPEGNTDISIDGDHATPIDGFISTIGKYEEIHTDRLHVAIAAAIQGVKVNLYPGSYFKK